MEEYVNDATAAHAQEKNEKAKEYSKIKIKLTIFNLLLTVAIFVGLIASPMSFILRDWALMVTDNAFGVVFFYFLFFYILLWVFDFPLDYYSSFILEHKYELSNQTFRAWVWEDAKKRVLSFALGVFVIEILYAVIRVSPAQWWLWCWGIWMLLSLVLGKLVPIFIVPLFYKYTEIEDADLKSTIMALVEGTGLSVSNVYSLNLSKTTKKANAAFLGLGKTKRVVLGDTLLENFSKEEIAVVLAHEVGHCKLKHILKHIVSSSVLSLFAFFIAARTLSACLDVFGFEAMHDIATFPLICFVVFLFNMLVMPLQNGYSRQMEREADSYAVEKTKMKEEFVSAMKKLGELNLADPSPHPVIEWFFYSHPAIHKRIQRIEKSAG